MARPFQFRLRDLVKQVISLEPQQQVKRPRKLHTRKSSTPIISEEMFKHFPPYAFRKICKHLEACESKTIVQVPKLVPVEWHIGIETIECICIELGTPEITAKIVFNKERDTVTFLVSFNSRPYIVIKPMY